MTWPLIQDAAGPAKGTLGGVVDGVLLEDAASWCGIDSAELAQERSWVVYT